MNGGGGCCVCGGRVLWSSMPGYFCQEIHERLDEGVTTGIGGFRYFWEVLYR